MLPRAGKYKSVKISEPFDRVTFVCVLPSEAGEVEVICVKRQSDPVSLDRYIATTYLGIVLHIHTQLVQVNSCLLRESRPQPRQELVRIRDERDLSLWILRTRLEPPRSAVNMPCDLASSLHARRSTTSDQNRLRGLYLSISIRKRSLDFLMAIATAGPDRRL